MLARRDWLDLNYGPLRIVVCQTNRGLPPSRLDCRIKSVLLLTAKTKVVDRDSSIDKLLILQQVLVICCYENDQKKAKLRYVSIDTLRWIGSVVNVANFVGLTKVSADNLRSTGFDI